MGLDSIMSLDGPVLITGHTGFKGTWLTRYLMHVGLRVVGFSLKPEETDLYTRAGLQGQIDEKFSDIRSYAELKSFCDRTKPAAIFHLAAQPLVIESYRDPLTTFEINVMGTANLLEAARTTDSVKAVVVVTTDKVYQNVNYGNRFKETDALLGLDPYSASKVGAENAAIAWRQLGKIEHKANISVVRSGNVIGGGDISKDRLLADVVRSRISGSKLQIRNPKSTRPWQHVLDPLSGYVRALEKSLDLSRGDNFNFGPTEPALEVETVIKLVQNSWPDIRFEIIEPKEGTYESQLLDLDSTYAQKILSWAPKYSQAQAIAKTLDWWDETLTGRVSILEGIDKHVKDFLE